MNTPPVQNQNPADDRADLPLRQASATGGCEFKNAPAQAGWFTCADVALALGRDKKTIRAQARREQWPSRPNGNREEFIPPPEIARLIIAAPAQPRAAAPEIRVRFSDLTPGTEQHTKALRREEAVLLFRSQLALGKELALSSAAVAMTGRYIDFACSARAIRRWVIQYEAHGLDGLVEQKLGIVGVKPCAADLTQEQLLSAAAAAVGHGQWKRNKTTERLNIAAAFRDTVMDPTIRGDARAWLHGARASKSRYPESFKKAIRQIVSPLAATMMQVGKKAAKLDGPYTDCDYSDGSANHAVTADDMTANHYVWLEWRNDRGFVLVRPQILAAMHVGSLCWLNARAIVSARRLKAGQTTASSTYDKHDVFGLFGDLFDDIGLFADEFDQPNMIFVLEGGIWQAKNITGEKYMPDDDLRYGGLRSLGKGIKLIHTRTPMGKAVIEGAFHTLQATGDDLPGYTGRDSRHDMPEQTKANIARVKSGEHPRSMFLHFADYQAHVARTMHNLNTTRNDGKICRGMTPLEKFQSLNLRTVVFPERLKYLYRSAYAVEKVKRNGFTISKVVAGTNVSYTYDHPDLENYRGTKVVGYWNDSNPSADAVIFTIKNGRPDKRICVASYVPSPSRFGGTEHDLASEATRKSLKVSMASSQAKTIAPLLQRNVKLAELAPTAAAIGDVIQRTHANSAKKAAAQADVAKIIRDNAEDILDDAGAGRRSDDATAPAQPAEPISLDELNELSAPAPDASALKENSDGSFDYQLQPSGSQQAQYVDYLVKRLTDFRKAGASFGQSFNHVSIAVTMKIAKSHLGCDLHDESRFNDVCAYLKSKINTTILGKRNAAKGTRNYHELAEHTAH